MILLLIIIIIFVWFFNKKMKGIIETKQEYNVDEKFIVKQKYINIYLFNILEIYKSRRY